MRLAYRNGQRGSSASCSRRRKSIKRLKRVAVCASAQSPAKGILADPRNDKIGGLIIPRDVPDLGLSGMPHPHSAIHFKRSNDVQQLHEFQNHDKAYDSSDCNRKALTRPISWVSVAGNMI